MNTLNIRDRGLTAVRRFAWTLIVALTSSSALGQVNSSPPERMTYQGFLVDGDGNALGDPAPMNFDVVFSIYADESSTDTGVSNLLWREQQTVPVDKGYFSVILGEGADGDPVRRPDLSTIFGSPTASDRYVGITVKGIGAGGSNVDILPRLRLLTSPYSFLSQNAIKLVQENGSDLISASEGVLTLRGSSVTVEGSGPGIFKIDGTSGHSQLLLTMNGVLKSALSHLASDGSLRLYHNSADRLIIAANGAVTVPGALSAASFSGNGAGLTGLTAGQVGGVLSVGQIPNLNANKITAGVFSSARIPTTLSGTTINGPLGVQSSHVIQLGVGISKGAANGQIGYGTYSGGLALDIVGAGTATSNRRINFHAQGGSQFFGPINISGSVNTSTSLEAFSDGGGWVDLSGTQVAGPYVLPHSIVADSRIIAAAFDIPSDARIKKIIGITESKLALQTLRQLEVKDYLYVDRVRHDRRPQRGFIAQQVEQVMPEAISQSSRVVPDIYAPSISTRFNPGTQALTIAVEKPHGMAVGDQVHLVLPDRKADFKVTSIPSATEFVVNAEQHPEKVFVYGRKVEDFRAVDYDRLFVTGVAAIQELAKQVDALRRSEARIAELEIEANRVPLLEQEIQELKSQVSMQQEKNKSWEARMVTLEKLVRSTRNVASLSGKIETNLQ